MCASPVGNVGGRVFSPDEWDFDECPTPHLSPDESEESPSSDPSPLWIACTQKNFPEALRLLDDPALKLDPLDMSCVSALEAACNNNAQELALKLLEKGAEPPLNTPLANRLLFWACNQRPLPQALIEMLIQCKGDLDYVENYKSSLQCLLENNGNLPSFLELIPDEEIETQFIEICSGRLEDLSQLSPTNLALCIKSEALRTILFTRPDWSFIKQEAFPAFHACLTFYFSKKDVVATLDKFTPDQQAQFLELSHPILRQYAVNAYLKKHPEHANEKEELIAHAKDLPPFFVYLSTRPPNSLQLHEISQALRDKSVQARYLRTWFGKAIDPVIVTLNNAFHELDKLVKKCPKSSALLFYDKEDICYSRWQFKVKLETLLEALKTISGSEESILEMEILYNFLYQNFTDHLRPWANLTAFQTPVEYISELRTHLHIALQPFKTYAALKKALQPPPSTPFKRGLD